MDCVYLDNAASTPVKAEVLAKFNEVAEGLYGNPSSQHSAGVEAYKEVQKAKEIISQKINCKSDEIFFTSGATMSNNILIQGMLRKHPETTFITSVVEHNDIMELYDWLPYSKHMVSVNDCGIVNIFELDKYIEECAKRGAPCLVSIQMANSETGVIQPIQLISRVVHSYSKSFLHMDATQYVPYFAMDLDAMGIDALSMSGQKIGGLKGSGLLVVRQMMQDHVAPVIFGEQGLVGGTYPTPLIASLGKAFELLEYNNMKLLDLRNYFIGKLIELGGELVGTKDNRLPNNIFIRFPGINGLTLMNVLNEYNIYVGTGSACSTDSDKPSHVAMAYGLSEAEAHECVRFTLGRDTMKEQIDSVLPMLTAVLSLLGD